MLRCICLPGVKQQRFKWNLLPNYGGSKADSMDEDRDEDAELSQVKVFLTLRLEEVNNKVAPSFISKLKYILENILKLTDRV